MEIVAKENIQKEHLSITKNKFYETKIHIYNWLDDNWKTIEYFEFFDDNNQRKVIHPKDLYKFFYTKQEFRKLKLNKLNTETD